MAGLARHGLGPKDDVDRTKPGLLLLSVIVLILTIWTAWVAALGQPGSRHPLPLPGR